MERKLNTIITKDEILEAEKLIKKFVFDNPSKKWNGDQRHCVHCNKFFPSHKHSWEFDLDDNNNSSWHPDFTDSVTGYHAIGKGCAKKLGINDILKKYWKFNKSRWREKC